MALRAGAIVRQTGPHRLAAGLIIGMALAWRASHPSIPVRSGALGAGAATAWSGLFAVLLLVLAAVGFRLRPADPAWARTLRIVASAAGAAAAIAALVLLVAGGSWPGAALSVAFLAVELARQASPRDLARRVPFEAFALAGEGALVPLVGYAAVAGEVGPMAMLVLTVPNALALALAASLAGPAVAEPGTSLWSLFPAPLHAVLALAATSGSIVVVLAGAAVSLRPELALLAVPVASMALVFGWLALLDPRPERRRRRVEHLVTVASIALAFGVAFVLVFA
ncbi:MAG: hypothetical protein ACOC2D_07975 [Spirochaetota bacterium]